MHKYDEMPKSGAHLNKMFEVAKNEWYNTQEGLQYKQRCEEMHAALDTLYADMDTKVSAYLAAKYPV